MNAEMSMLPATTAVMIVSPKICIAAGSVLWNKPTMKDVTAKTVPNMTIFPARLSIENPA